jgi:CheY-like chemotaxis protein
MSRGESEQKTVMVVDDYDEVRLLTKRALESFGYRVLEASSGPEAVRLAQAESPDLILMDLSMPNMDGFATMHQIRRLHGLRNVPVIAFSAHTAKEIREDALAAGCREFVTKPVHFDRLKAIVERHLRPS